MSSNSEHTNELIHETSPYLLQHAHNPVDWYPWGNKALEKAKKKNKLLIVSIGYSSCHWCHVMEHESFEDKQVAEIMNQEYVSVKVDREERPDIDQVYMNAAYLLTGSGGWPLNVIALPDGRPVYAGTYFPMEHWIKVLQHFTGLFKEQPALLEEQAGKIEKGLVDMDNLPQPIEPQPLKGSEIEDFTSSIINNIDFEKGGTRGAPKFPMPNIYSYLLHHHALTGDAKSLLAVDTTLTRMAMGGIYDQIGGGFARYSVDDRWFVPHFEKMLYDNAQLISLYSMAYQQSKNPLYKQVVYECTGFIEREMTSPQGAFYAALDADSEGIEGKFYTWSSREISDVLGKDAARFRKFFNISDGGNWEKGQNILYINQLDEEYLFSKKLKHLKSALLEARSKRVRPGLDNKVLTSWNALMLSAYVDAYRAFNDSVFIERALESARFLEKWMVQDDSSILRNYMNDQASINGFLDDYAFTIGAFINLYQASFQEEWLHLANRLVVYVLSHFSDEESGTFFYTSDEDRRLITRSRELSDNVIPSSNSQMAKNLFFLGTFLEKRNYIVRASQLMMAVREKMLRHPSFHSNWGMMMLNLSEPPIEVVIMGNDCIDMRAEFDRYYLPHVVFAGGKDEGSLELVQQRLVKGQTTIYVCRDKTCKLPVTSVRAALKQLEGWAGAV